MRKRAVAVLLAALMTYGMAVTGLTGCGNEEGSRRVRSMFFSETWG